MREFKFEAILVLEFKKIENDDETKFTTFYFNAKAQTIINIFNKHVDLLLIEQKDKTHYVLMKYFNTFMYDHILLRG